MSEDKLEKVTNALDKVPLQTKQMIYNMSNGMSDTEIIQSFNQQTFDFFNTVSKVAKENNMDKSVNADGYRSLFDNAIKINNKLPIDKFTLIILEFAAEIYNEDENCFLKMSIPDKNVNVGNEFGIIRSEMFKKLWVTLKESDKKEIKENLILLTTYAHAYLYKTISNLNKN